MGRKRRQTTNTSSSQSDSSTSNSSLSNISGAKSGQKKPKTVIDPPVNTQAKEKLTRFAFDATCSEMEAREDNMAAVADDVFTPGLGTATSSSAPGHGVSNEDLMSKLCANGSEISKLKLCIEELRSSILSIQIENDNLKKEVTEVRKREEELKSQLAEVKFTAELADRRSEELGAYIRRNNLRIFGVAETNEGRSEETPGVCEEKVLKLFKDKLKVKVAREDIEAIHRLGPRRTTSTGHPENRKSAPRGIIVRFVSRRVRDTVLYSRKLLRGSGIAVVEDLTPRAYALLCTVRSDTSVCKQAWTKNGKIIMKTVNDRIVNVDSVSDLNSYRHINVRGQASSAAQSQPSRYTRL